jgi:ribosomal protein L11 methyltransferase
MPSAYIEISVEADAPLIEKLIAVLAQTGVEGFWEDTGTLRCYISRARWSDALAAETDQLIRVVARASASPVPKLTWREIEPQNWNAQWEKTIQPIRVTESITITPSWHRVVPEDGQLVLVIDPKMSFGTGYHETTRLSLRMLDGMPLHGQHVLDVGTGTGILAIAAAKLGAASVVALDIDEWAYSNAVENAERNGVAGSVQIHHCPLTSLPARQFDLIIANIQLDVIAGLLDDMLLRLKEKGCLILSGLLATDRHTLVALAGSKGLTILDELAENEWIAVRAGRRQR